MLFTGGCPCMPPLVHVINMYVSKVSPLQLQTWELRLGAYTISSSLWKAVINGKCKRTFRMLCQQE